MYNPDEIIEPYAVINFNQSYPAKVGSYRNRGSEEVVPGQIARGKNASSYTKAYASVDLIKGDLIYLDLTLETFTAMKLPITAPVDTFGMLAGVVLADTKMDDFVPIQLSGYFAAVNAPVGPITPFAPLYNDSVTSGSVTSTSTANTSVLINGLVSLVSTVPADGQITAFSAVPLSVGALFT